MKTASKTVLMVIIIIVMGYFASFLIPAPADWRDPSLGFHWTLSSSVLYTLLHTGAAVLFISGLSAYKAALRSAYVKIALGITLVGAGLAQVIVLTIFDLIQTPWVQYGGVMLPFVVAGLAIYSGVRSIATLVGVESPLKNRGLIVSLLVLCIAVISFMPHVASSQPEYIFDISNAISTWDVVLYAASLRLVWQIRARSGTHYTQATTWLAVGLVGSVIITSCILIGAFFQGKTPAGFFLDSIVIIGGLLYLKAGYSFAKTKEL